jgi:hypothetical protein
MDFSRAGKRAELKASNLLKAEIDSLTRTKRKG